MPNLLAMSFEGELAPSFDLRCLQPGRTLPDGWGIGYYPGGEPSAAVLKEPAPPPESIRSELVKAWESLASSLFVLHIRNATWGSNTDANTQPFERTLGGRGWLFAHSGSLRNRLTISPGARYEPVGSTDSERIFCELLDRMAENGARSIGDVPPETLRQWCADLNEHGSVTLAFADGHDLAIYADREGETQVHYWMLRPPYGRVVFGDEALEVDLSRRGIKGRNGVLVSTEPLASTGDRPAGWQQLAPGRLLILRQGVIRADVGEESLSSASRPVFASSTHRPLPVRAVQRTVDVVHRTVYQYQTAVERSSHVLRLLPAHDRTQSVLSSQITLSVDGARRGYEDEFGNQIERVLIERPYNELIIESRARVALLDVEPLSRKPAGATSVVPYLWMPWQQHMLGPYLLPPELPETQLVELREYATSFARRNDHDLIDTLLDLCSSIHREYRYAQGTTTVHTTPFEVYVARRGVCQDFTNLFMCMVRLLGIPARYTCGYLYTGPRHENRAQAEASHAWAQVYLPELGWKGFDPTNGVLTQTDHVRVAVGRNFADATPTSGTIYVGGGGETLSVDVQVHPL